MIAAIVGFLVILGFGLFLINTGIHCIVFLNALAGKFSLGGAIIVVLGFALVWLSYEVAPFSISFKVTP